MELTSVLMCDEKEVLSQNIVGKEYIICTHWINIVGAAAPTVPMVPTLMLPLSFHCSIK